MRSPLTLSKEDAERVREIERLAQLGAASVEALGGHLDDPSWAVRRAVVGALARIGRPSVAMLCQLLRTRRDNEARLAAAVDALAAARGEIDDAIIALAADEGANPALLCDAAQILGRRKSAVAVPTLERLALHPDDNVGVSAIEALGRVGGGAGLETVAKILERGNFFRSFPAIEVLGGSGDRRAVEPLLAALDKPLFAGEAVRALGHVGDERAVPALTALLRNGDDAFVRAAALGLVELQQRQHEQLGAADAVERALEEYESRELAGQRLRHCLTAADPSEQVAICQVLGWLRSEEALPALFALLLDEGPVAAAAVVVLQRFGRAIDPQLRVALAAGSSAERTRLLPLVAGRGAGLEEVTACLADPDASVRAAACDALARTGDPTPVAQLFQLLDDADPRVAQAATAAIQSLGSAETEKLALAASGSNRPAVRRAALRVIAYFGYRSGLDALLAAMNEPDDRLRDAAIAGLAFIEEPRALDALLAGAVHTSPKTRVAAMRALGQTSPADARVARVLVAALSDGEAWVRYYAVQSLGKLGDRSAVDVIVRLLGDPAGQVRVAVVDALAQLQTPAAFAALLEAARSADHDVQRSAVVGLGLSKRTEALPLIVEATRAADAATRLVALSALCQFDAPPVVPALRRAANDDDESVRSAAFGFLGARADTEATHALVGLLAQPRDRQATIAALGQGVAGRIPAILAALEDASGEVATVLVGALARAPGAAGEAALVAALAIDNVEVRRAAASALAFSHSFAALEALAVAAHHDADPEVRRICSLALGE
ncbi:MAG: lyase HEAT-like repeat protein [Myxococcales bacterium]|nr:lyase HEAT-like repeat protein [Myxococcales bacterium]